MLVTWRYKKRRYTYQSTIALVKGGSRERKLRTAFSKRSKLNPWQLEKQLKYTHTWAMRCSLFDKHWSPSPIPWVWSCLQVGMDWPSTCLAGALSVGIELCCRGMILLPQHLHWIGVMQRLEGASPHFRRFTTPRTRFGTSYFVS